MTPRGRRIAWALAAAIVLLPPAIGAAYLLSIDPNTVKNRVIAGLEHATGREVAATALRLRLFPDLTLTASDVALANPVGFSRPEMLTVRRMVVRIALIPLLADRVIVRAITLDGLDLRLEQPPGAAGNWRFTPRQRSATLPRALKPPRLRQHRLRAFTVLAIDAQGQVAWRTPRTSGTLDLTRLRLREVNASSTITLLLDGILDGQGMTIAGRLGGQSHLWNPQDRTPWPVVATIRAADGEVTMDGTFTAPRILAGYDLAITADGTDLAGLLSTWPELRWVPRLRDASLRTRLIDRPDGLDIPRLALTAAASDLSATAPGLLLDRLRIAAPNIDGFNGTLTNAVSADGSFAGARLALSATLGPVGRLFGRGEVAARTPITLDATGTAAGASIQLQGRVQPSGDWNGTDLTLQAAVPDLAVLSPLTGRALPALRGIALDGAVRSAGGVLTLTAAHLTLPQADVLVSGTAHLRGRQSYAGTIHVARLDIDALPKLWPLRRLHPKPPPPDSDTTQAAPPRPAQPFAVLTQFDADLALTDDTLRYRGVTITGFDTLAQLASGRLDIAPAKATIDGAAVGGSLSIAADHDPPVVALDLAAPGQNAAAIAALLGAPGTARGKLDIDAALTGSGRTGREIAASLNGRLGVALTDGALSRAVVLRLLAALGPSLGDHLPVPGDALDRIACLATRFDLSRGIATPQDFLLNTPRFRLAVAGTIDLGARTFDLRLRPFIGVGAFGVIVPARASGPWRDPTLHTEPAGGPPPGALALADSGDCAPALAAARDPGAPLPAVPSEAKAKSRRPSAVDLLRRLFR